LRKSHHAVAEHGHPRRDRDRRAQRVVPVGAARCERDRKHAHDHGERERDADRVGIEPLGREPQRQERQLHAERDEQRGVEHRKPPRKCGSRRQWTDDGGQKVQLQCPLSGLRPLSSD
jgi:hypothetical protein